jgi:FMN phosphatase YigB (HAD superfamily)
MYILLSIFIMLFFGAFYFYRKMRLMPPVILPDKSMISNRSNVVITFDLHGVLFAVDYKKMIHLLFTTKKTLRLLGALFWFPLWMDIYYLWSTTTTAEKYILFITEKYRFLFPCKNLLFACASAQKPIVSTIEVAKNLKASGYVLHIFSNIGPKMLAMLQLYHKGIFDLFDVIHISNEKNNYKGKPEISVFYQYIREHALQNKIIIFVDDTRKNILVARKIGMIGIYYRSVRQFDCLRYMSDIF